MSTRPPSTRYFRAATTPEDSRHPWLFGGIHPVVGITSAPTSTMRTFHLGMMLLWCVAVFFPTVASASERLAVLVYHHLEDPTKSDVSCTPREFSVQMKALLDAGFTPLNLDRTRQFLAGALPGISKPLLITFDDGYASLFEHALPVAEALHIPMTVFIVTGRIGRQPQFSRYLSAGEIRAMANSGWFEFGSHTHDLHTDIMRIYLSFSGNPNPVEPMVQEDLTRSFSVLTKILGHPPRALAWPYGKFNAHFQHLARDIGFFLHFTSISGYNEPGSDPFSVKRIPITSRDTAASVLRKAEGR